MKTTIRESFKSSYQAIIDYFSWLFHSEKQKSPIYETDIDVEEIEIKAVVIESQIETIKPKREQLTKKQKRMLEIVEEYVGWVDSSKIGDIYCIERYGENARAGGSMYASKTLNKLVKFGFLVKNNKKKYKKA